MKKTLIGLTVGAVLALGATTAYAATTLCYYSFGPVAGGQSSFYSTTTFSTHTGKVAVKGWQETTGYPNTSPTVCYSVVKKGVLWDSYFGDEQCVRGYYGKNGTWFYTQIPNVPNDSGYSLRMDPTSSDYTLGAGNGYE